MDNNDKNTWDSFLRFAQLLCISRHLQMHGDVAGIACLHSCDKGVNIIALDSQHNKIQGILLTRQEYILVSGYNM